MERLTKLGALAACAGSSLLLAVIGLPMIAFGGGAFDTGNQSDRCGTGGPAAPSDGTPSILGPTTLTYTELTTWWDATGRYDPLRLVEPIHQTIGRYLDEGAAEGVRGDIAFAQALHETGHFTSPDTGHNNFAGIGHHDGAASGQAFPDVATGVRAHIQLLKRYAAGNDTQLAHPAVAPNAGASARTWGELAGTWASNPNYWTDISHIYNTMLNQAGRDIAPAPAGHSTACASGPDAVGPPTGQLTNVRGIVVDSSIATQLDALLAAAEADGVHLTGSGYRSHQRQIELRRINGCPDLYISPASACNTPTARPGNSMHELGLAIDFDRCASRSTRCWQWLNTHAAHYGLFNLPSESWHWSTDGT